MKILNQIAEYLFLFAGICAFYSGQWIWGIILFVVTIILFIKRIRYDLKHW